MKGRRQEQIVDFVLLQGAATVVQLSEVFKVSSMTIRRDLEELEREGAIARVPGGAISRDGGRRDPPYRLRIYLNAEEKRRMAEVASALVADGDLIWLDIGTTCLELSKHIGRRNVTVVTNWLPNMLELARGGQCEIFNTGGKINGSELSSVGVAAFNSIGGFWFDKAFLGIGGLARDELSDFVLESAEIKKRVLERAKEVIVMADDSKFDRQAPIRIAPVSAANRIVVCDATRVQERIHGIIGMGVEVVGIDMRKD